MSLEPALSPDQVSPSASVLEFLEWIDAHAHTYSETMDAWRTSCPRFPVWEDAVDGGLVERVKVGREALVRLTHVGREFLSANRE